MCLDQTSPEATPGRDHLRSMLLRVAIDAVGLPPAYEATCRDDDGLVTDYGMTDFEVLEVVRHFEIALTKKFKIEIILTDPENEGEVVVGSLVTEALEAIADAFAPGIPRIQTPATESAAA